MREVSYDLGTNSAGPRAPGESHPEVLTKTIPHNSFALDFTTNQSETFQESFMVITISTLQRSARR